ncbi:MAG: sodium/solute symporter [Planctomycetia bacterium]|nr:sodium/solute symporter [Planctomycetia bacterium]
MPSLIAAAPARHAGMGWFDYALVLVYLLFTAGIVWWSSRREANTEQFFLGGRRMPWFAVGLSIMATLLSTITYLGMPGEFIKHGITAMAQYIAYPLVVPVVFCLFVPFFMRLRLTSVYEYLERRFNSPTRILGGTLFFFLKIGWIALVMYSAALALEMMAHADVRNMLTPLGLADHGLYVMIFALGLTATSYAFFGGMRAVVWTDVLQAVMLFGGALVIIIYVMATTGEGISVWWDAVASQRTSRAKPILFDVNPTTRLTVFTVILNGFFWAMCTHGSDQVVLQRYFTTTSIRAARNSFLINIAAQVLIGVLLALAGLALLYFYLVNPQNLGDGLSVKSSTDKIMPYFYAHQLPLGFGGLILANFLCDAMQTLVSGVNSMTAVASNDLFRGDGSKRSAAEADRRQLVVARAMTLGIGLFCTCLAAGTAWLAQRDDHGIYELLPRTFNMFLGPLASLFFVGMFIPRATARSVLPAAALALFVSVSWTWWKQLYGIDHQWYIDLFRNPETPDVLPGPPSIMWSIFVPCSVGFFTSAILSRIVDKNEDHPGRAYSWQEIMKRPPPQEDRS